MNALNGNQHDAENPRDDVIETGNLLQAEGSRRPLWGGGDDSELCEKKQLSLPRPGKVVRRKNTACKGPRKERPWRIQGKGGKPGRLE